MQIKDLSSIIREKRKSLGLNQLDVAMEIDISYRHYQDVEAGKANIKFETLIKLISFYNLELVIDGESVYEKSSKC